MDFLWEQEHSAGGFSIGDLPRNTPRVNNWQEVAEYFAEVGE
jgi:hypothetical protein